MCVSGQIWGLINDNRVFAFHRQVDRQQAVLLIDSSLYHGPEAKMAAAAAASATSLSGDDDDDDDDVD